MKYEVRKNTINDYKFIVFKYAGNSYKAMAMSDGGVWLWLNLSAFKGECYNLQLLKCFNCKIEKYDFDSIYNIAISYFK